MHDTSFRKALALALAGMLTVGGCGPGDAQTTATPVRTSTDTVPVSPHPSSEPPSPTVPAATPTTEPTPEQPCSAYAGDFESESIGALAVTLNADCSVDLPDGRHYAMVGVRRDAAPKGTLPTGGGMQTVEGSLVIDLEPTEHGTVNVYALFPVGVAMGFDDEEPLDVQRVRLISLAGGPYSDVPYGIVHDGLKFRAH